MNHAHALKAPFPYFGGKSKIAHLAWERFGDVPNYVEPFAGSLAVLLGRPHEPRLETVNDIDCYLANFWRAIKYDPLSVAYWASWPVNEADLVARHNWIIDQEEFRRNMKGDPEFYDAWIAGWWVWGLCCWIGSGWCKAPSPKRSRAGKAAQGVQRKLPQLGSGHGINRVSLARENETDQAILEYFSELSGRLRRVRVCCGDWSRVLGRSVTYQNGLTAILLDPPYGDAKRERVYNNDSFSVASDVRRWAIENGENPLLRIALCGYEGEHEMPENWTCVPWKANGGYANRGGGGNENARRERVWFSPHCLKGAGVKTE